MSFYRDSKEGDTMLALPQVGTCSRIQAELRNPKYNRLCDLADFNGKKESYQTMMFGESTIKVKSTWPDLLDIIKECEAAHKPKPPAHNSMPSYPRQLSFVEKHRIGSHREHQEWAGYGGKIHTANPIITDFETVYLDCLPGKAWVEASGGYGIKMEGGLSRCT
jgi:hypothetical protein